MELKPCPFCGSKNISSGEVMTMKPEYKEDHKFYLQNSCMDCGANGPTTEHEFGIYNHKTDEAWNTRLED